VVDPARPLAGQVALVTGASGGIGRVIAQHHAAAGAAVVLVARRAAALAETARLVRDAGGECLVHVADISVEDACIEAVAATVTRFGRLDVLVNNAAVPGTDELVVDATVENWRSTWTTNVLAPMVLSREALRQAMIPAARGNIQMLSSAAAKNVLQRKAHYATAKLALIPFAQTLAKEVGPHGVRVNTLVIGTVRGELVEAWVARRAGESGDDPEALLAQLASASPLQRLVEPAEVADMSVWLASDGASAITGQNINVTAGTEMR